MNGKKEEATWTVSGPNLLLVEGDEDKKLFVTLIQSLGIIGLQVSPMNGKDNLGSHLKTLKKRTNNFLNIDAIGIIRDADPNPETALQSVQQSLKNNDLLAPERAMEPEGEKPRVIIMILPGGEQMGSLETLCMKSVADDPAMECVDKYLTCLDNKKIQLPPNRDKTKSQAFLASRKKLAKDIGVAAQQGQWNFDSPAFDEVKQFLGQIVKGPERIK